MTVLEWDKPSEKTFQTGVDHGVLYLKDGTSVVWNGLTSVEDTSNSELKSYYLDGIVFLNQIIPGDFQGQIQAFTYPDEFDSVVGLAQPSEGLFYHDQPAKQFGLSYRTRIGDDISGIDVGYKLHLLYNLLAIPDSKTFGTIQEQVDPLTFGWSITAMPVMLPGYRPTAHISIDSRFTPESVLEDLEEVLYGTSLTEPRLPTIDEVYSMFAETDVLNDLVIVDNGDGTWSATDSAVPYISMLDPDTIEITGADATYVDPDTYTITDTDNPIP